MKLHIQITIADVRTGSADRAARLGRLARGNEHRERRNDSFHRKICAPATYTCSEPNNTTTLRTKPPKSTRIDAVATS